MDLHSQLDLTCYPLWLSDKSYFWFYLSAAFGILIILLVISIFLYKRKKDRAYWAHEINILRAIKQKVAEGLSSRVAAHECVQSVRRYVTRRFGISGSMLTEQELVDTVSVVASDFKHKGEFFNAILRLMECRYKQEEDGFFLNEDINLIISFIEQTKPSNK